jgi:N-acetylglucosamine-6-sulfatase
MVGSQLCAAAAVSLTLLASACDTIRDQSRAVPDDEVNVAAAPRVTVSPATAVDRPNILLITTDDQNADELRWMPRTRRLLGRHGTTFSDAISAHPLCCPARAQLLTGQYAHNNGVRHNHGPWGGFKTLHRSETLATWLTEAGYATGFVGKFLNEYPATAPAVPGWSVWDPTLTGWYAYFGTTFLRPHSGSPAAYSTAMVSARTSTYLGALSASGSPFFLWASHVAPHATWTAPEVWDPPVSAPRHAGRFRGASAPSTADPAFGRPARGAEDLVGQTGPWTQPQIDRYFRQRIRSLLAVDEAVAAAVRELRRLGELRNTYVIFASDNGYLLGEHGLVGKNVLYRQALEVPMLVRGPGVRQAAFRDEPVMLADVAATVVEIAGAETGVRLDGASLLPLLAGNDAGWRDTTLVLTGSMRGVGASPGWGYRGVRTDRYTFGVKARTGRPLLFDRRLDPSELHDVARSPRYRAVVEELGRRTRALVGCSGRECSRRFSE